MRLAIEKNLSFEESWFQQLSILFSALDCWQSIKSFCHGLKSITNLVFLPLLVWNFQLVMEYSIKKFYFSAIQRNLDEPENAISREMARYSKQFFCSTCFFSWSKFLSIAFTWDNLFVSNCHEFCPIPKSWNLDWQKRQTYCQYDISFSWGFNSVALETTAFKSFFRVPIGGVSLLINSNFGQFPLFSRSFEIW